MTLPVDIAAWLGRVDAWWLTALDATIKVTLLLALAGLLSVALGRASAAIRHLVWALGLASALLLPILSIALPRWQLPILTVAAPSSIAPPAAEPLTVLAPPTSLGRGFETKSMPSVAATTTSSTPPRAEPLTIASTGTRTSLTMLLGGIWLAGVVAVAGRLLIGLIAVQWLSRRTARVVDAPWLPLAVQLASELRITRRVRFLESARATMPIACGVVTPSVLMPADASRWPLERLRIVLLHELAHVKRRDCLTHVIAQLACALYWFNPLAWIAARRVRTERERACDDLVLASGTRGSDYAEELLEIARGMRSGRYPAFLAGATLAMAHRSQLEGRLMAILDPKVPRSSVSRVTTVLAATAVACALPPLASLQPWTIAAAEDPSASRVDPAVVMLPADGSATQEREVAAPRPQPAPAPHVRPQLDGRVANADRENDDAEAEVNQQSAQAEAQKIAQNEVQSAVQSAVQGATQGAVQSVVQGAVHGVLAAAGGEYAEQDAKRGNADPRMVAALTAALKDSDKDVRETAMHALIQLRDPSIFEPLVQALKDSSPDVREQAAQGLSQLRDKRAVDPLIGALKDQNASVREHAAHALGQLRDPRAVDGLLGALKDENPSVREHAAHALGQIRDPRAVDGLILALKDQNADVRENVAFALSQLRDKRATAALAGAIKDPNPDVRQQAVFALGQIRDASAIDGLMTALRDAKPDVRQQAAFALGQIRDPRAVEPLISALKDEAPDVRQQAAFGLGQIRDRAAVEALIIAIKDSNADVRQQVAFALGQIRDPRAIDALTGALKDSSADVRQQAAFALGQLAR
jgi:HEAT repeat protein/beta-lactamase regulating signal transducer with metallopeptidase domain